MMAACGAAGRGGEPDHRVVAGILKDARIELLHNRAVQLPTTGQSISVVGVGDLWSDEIDATRAFAGVDESGPVILLSHNPDSKDMVRRSPRDLMLSGHTHGGQVVLPEVGPRFAPVEDRRYVEGLKPWGARQIHVTRGVGSFAGVRFRCRPEVSLLVLQ